MSVLLVLDMASTDKVAIRYLQEPLGVPDYDIYWAEPRTQVFEKTKLHAGNVVPRYLGVARL